MAVGLVLSVSTAYIVFVGDHIRSGGMGGYYTDEGHYRSDDMDEYYTTGGDHQRSEGIGVGINRT